MDFQKVIASDSIRHTLLTVAEKEKLLLASAAQKHGSLRRDSCVQDTLSLLVLFDQILLPVGDPSIHIPSLESEGIIRIIDFDLQSPTPRSANQYPQTILPGGEKELTILEPTIDVRPFVLNELMALKPTPIEKAMFQRFSLARRKFYDALLDYAIALYRYDVLALYRNPLSELLPDRLLDTINKVLSEHPHEEDKLNWLDTICIIAGITAQEISALQDLSNQLNAGVATKHFATNTADWTPVTRLTPEVTSMTKSFCLLRLALNEGGKYFPKITSINHALQLRKDANLKSFREQLQLFHSHISSGDKDAVIRIRKEITKARRALERTAMWATQLRWVTYLSLPVGIIESIALGAPIAATTLGVFSATLTAQVQRSKRKNEWVLFGH